MDIAQALKARLTAALAPADLEIVDNSASHAGHAGNGGGGHFNISLSSAQFAGLSLLQRHRLVYAAAGDLLPQHIHALSIVAKLPD